jgi:hypothetical protein
MSVKRLLKFGYLIPLIIWSLSLKADSTSLSDLDALRYIASHSDLIQAFGADARKGREHYQNNGLKEGRKITFETWRYMASHSDVIQAFGLDPIAGTRHYITNGYREARKVDFESYRYIASHSDLISAFGLDPEAGARHYVGWGYREGRKISFPAYQYLASYPDLMDAFGDDTEAASRHYIGWGVKEGRRVSFDGYRYIASHPDLITAFGDDPEKAARHYVTAGRREGRGITFDIWRYIASYSDLIVAFGNDLVAAARHYITSGYREGRTLLFDSLAYIASYSDLIQAFGTDAIAGARHYVESGYREGRQILFDAAGYLARHSDLQTVFGGDTLAATLHYVNSGWREGRGYLLSVNVKISGSGAASATQTFVEAGQRVQISLEPDEGHYLKSINGCPGSLEGSTFKSAPISSSCTLSAVFAFDDRPFFVDVSGAMNVAIPFPQASSTTNLVADVNNDGRDDFVLHLWDGSKYSGKSAGNAPCPNSLVFMINQGNHLFIDQTSSYLTGEADLGGCTRKMKRADINGDLIDDVVFAVNQEDGRLQAVSVDMNAQMAAVVSTGSGHLIKRFGPQNWYHSIGVGVAQDGRRFVTGNGYTTQSDQIYFFDAKGNSTPEKPPFPAVSPTAFTFLASKGSQASSSLLQASNATNRYMDVIGHAIDTQGNWVELTPLEIAPLVGRINAICYTGEPCGEPPVFDVNGYKISFAGLPEVCSLRLSPDDAEIAVFHVTGASIPNFKDGALVRQNDLLPISTYRAARVQGNAIVSQELIIEGEQVNQINSNFFDCKDVNGDGYDDIVKYPYDSSGAPYVYLNTKTAGKFKYVDRSNFPSAKGKFGNAATSVMNDFDGDGLQDIVIFPGNGISGVKSVEYLYFKGNRPLR